MPLLDASLAFALTMLALASVVTLLTEVIHRVLRLRAKGLQTMLDGLYENELRPWVEKKAGQVIDETGRDFCDLLQKNPLLRRAKLQASMFKTDALSGEELLQRLGRTQLGEKIRQIGEREANELRQAATVWLERFDDYGAAATELFARRAKLISLLAGIVLAFVGNLNAVKIVDGYLRDAAAVQDVVGRSESLQANWRKTDADLAAALDALEGGEPGALARIESSVSQLNGQLLSLGGLPIGYERFSIPWSGSASLKTWTLWSWFLSVLLTGYLLGLGGPFWFKVVVRLNQIRQTLTGPVQAPTSSSSPSAAAVLDEKDPLELLMPASKIDTSPKPEAANS